MAGSQEDEGDVSDFDARIAEIAAAARSPAPAPGDDYARHLLAEDRWQTFLRTRRLWEQVKRWMVLGR